MIELALKTVMSELDEARATLERARQRLLDYDPVEGELGAMKIAVDVDLRAVLRFLGCEE